MIWKKYICCMQSRSNRITVAACLMQRAFFAFCGAFSFYLFDLMHMLCYTLWWIYFIAKFILKCINNLFWPKYWCKIVPWTLKCIKHKSHFYRQPFTIFLLPKRFWTKEYLEGRHGEPNKFLFLPKMGLLGSQAGNYELSATF